MEEVKKDYYCVGSRQDIVVSNSSLSYIDPETGGSPQKFLSFFDYDKERKNSLSLERGSLVHLYCEHPESFLISDLEKPSENISKIIEEVYRQHVISDGTKTLEELTEIILNTAKKINYGQKWLPETVTKKVNEEGKEYLDFLIKSEGMIIMSKATQNIVTKCIQSLNVKPSSRKLLFDEDEFSNILYLNELEIYGEHGGLKTKGKVDRVIVDFDKKTVKVPDIKTTSKSAYLFKESFEFYRYYRQHAFYRVLIFNYLKENYPNIDFTEFIFESYNVVVETCEPFNTVVYEVDEEYIQKGLVQVFRNLNRIQAHIDTGDWSMSIEESEMSDNILKLTLDKEKDDTEEDTE